MSNPSATTPRSLLPGRTRLRGTPIRRRALRTVALLACVQGWTSEAVAHPFGNRFTAQRLEVEVGVDVTTIHLTADVPDPLLRFMVPEADDAVGTLLGRLDHGLVVTVDGRRLDLEVVDKTSRVDLVQGTDHVLEATWRVRADLRGRHQLRVSNGNLGDQPSYFRDEVRLPPASRLHGTNLVVTHRGRRVALHDAWAPTEGLRRVDLDVEIPDDRLVRAFRAVSTATWDVPTASIAPAAAWTAGRTDPATTLGSIGVSAALGLGASLAAGRRRAPIALGGALAVLPLALGAPDAGALGVIVGAAALIGGLQPGFAALAPALVAPWAAASVEGPLRGLTVAAWLVGAALGAPWRRARGLGLALLALTAVAAAARG